MHARLAPLGPTYGSHAQVACARGDVWAAAVCAGFDRQQRIAFYAVRISNNSELPLRARLRGARSAPPGNYLAIAPFSILETLVPMYGSALATGEQARVDVTGPGVAFSIDAPVPSFLLPSERSLGLRVAALVGALVLLAGIVVTALISQSLGKTRTVAAHTLAIPSSQRPVHRAVRRVVATPDLSPLLDDLTVGPLPAHAGAALRVAYTTAATAGDVWLLDLHGQVWAHTAIDRSGTTWLHVPAAAAGREMRVVVHAARGQAHAQMGAGILVLPDDANVASVAGDAGDARPAATAPGVAVSPARASAGQPIHVAWGASRGEALVSLTDASGSVVQEVDVPAGRNGITLVAPNVSGPTTYDVVVSVSHGVSEESIVRPVIVVP